MTAAATTDVRAEAERHLRALVGSEDAVLRDDQWTAIEALAIDRRRALVVQRTGWGKSAVYFVATLLLRVKHRRLLFAANWQGPCRPIWCRPTL